LDYVDLHLGNGCFSHGQLYTALSRCRTLNGLILERPITKDDLILDEKVIDFYKTIDKTLCNEINNETTSNVTLDVPLEYVDKIKEYILKLKLENTDDAICAL